MSSIILARTRTSPPINKVGIIIKRAYIINGTNVRFWEQGLNNAYINITKIIKEGMIVPNPIYVVLNRTNEKNMIIKYTPKLCLILIRGNSAIDIKY